MIQVIQHGNKKRIECQNCGALSAVFGCCRGLTGGTRRTGYLQENCVDCPYLVLFDKKGERGK